MTWIKRTLQDENGNPSSNRQGAWLTLIATIIFSALGFEAYIIQAFAGLAGALFIGTQVPKLKGSSNSSSIGESEKNSEEI